MTREDRDLAIADNIEYVNRAVANAAPAGARPLVFLGFSQGVAMAYRAAIRGRHRASGIIALGGDVPPELKAGSEIWPPVLVGAGETDSWYTAAKVDADVAHLAGRGVPHEIVRYRGGHEWTDEFRVAAGRWLEARRRASL
jgi:predicted esterase